MIMISFRRSIVLSTALMAHERRSSSQEHPLGPSVFAARPSGRPRGGVQLLSGDQLVNRCRLAPGGRFVRHAALLASLSCHRLVSNLADLVSEGIPRHGEKAQ